MEDMAALRYAREALELLGTLLVSGGWFHVFTF